MTGLFSTPVSGGEIVLFDLEFTAWDGSMLRNWSEDWEFREIIQIGAVRIKDDASFTEVDRMVCYVNPVKNPILSDYIKDLTGINQDVIDSEGFEFEEALLVFLDFCNEAKTVFCFSGDHEILRENCELQNIPQPTWPVFGELGPLLGKQLGEAYAKSTSFGLQTLVGLEASGQEHDAMDDSLAMAAALRVLRKHQKV